MTSRFTESRPTTRRWGATPFAWIQAIVRSVDRLPAPVLRLLIAALLAAVTSTDVLSGIGERGELLYVLPVSIAAYHTTVRFGIAVSVASALLCKWATMLAASGAAGAWGWVATNRLGHFLFVSALLMALRRRFDEEKALARSDALTGVANRRHFRETAIAELARAQRYGHPVTIALLDVDDFERINDTLGHDGGDSVLREVAVLLPETGPEGAQLAAEKLRAALAQVMATRGRAVSFSVGAVTTLDPTRDLDGLLRRADELTFAVKRAGKDAAMCTVVAPDTAPERLHPACAS